jgi:competence protein ComEC
VQFEILNPPGYAYEQPTRKDNDKSCVLKITQGKHSLLLTADAERIGELEMTERIAGKLAATVLMAGHHGSQTSSIDEFVNLVKPEYVIYSNGWKNRFGHPHPDVMARFRDLGAQPHRTDYQGGIRIRLTERGPEFEHWRDRHVRYWQRPQ